MFYFAFGGNFQVQAPRGLIFGGGFNGGFFALRVWGAGLIFGGAYTWRVLFSESYGIKCRVEKRNFSSTEQRELRWGDVVINKDIDGKEYLEYFERQTKARTGEFFYKSDS